MDVGRTTLLLDAPRCAVSESALHFSRLPAGCGTVKGGINNNYSGSRLRVNPSRPAPSPQSCRNRRNDGADGRRRAARGPPIDPHPRGLAQRQEYATNELVDRPLYAWPAKHQRSDCIAAASGSDRERRAAAATVHHRRARAGRVARPARAL